MQSVLNGGHVLSSVTVEKTVISGQHDYIEPKILDVFDVCTEVCRHVEDR